MRSLIAGVNNIVIDNCNLSAGDTVTVVIVNKWNCKDIIEDVVVEAGAIKCKKMVSLNHTFECGVFTISLFNAKGEMLYINDFEYRCDDCNE